MGVINNRLSVCVLISCMHQDHTIIEKSNVQTDVVVVNQCDSNSIDEYVFKNRKGENCHVKFINTTERGLSRSRNMAIRNCNADICLISDDDEKFSDNYESDIISSYSEYPDAGFIAFAFYRIDKPAFFSDKHAKMGLKEIMKTASIQITFKRSLIDKYAIFFDEKMGSGTGNGGGEENKFLYDYFKKCVPMYYVPLYITTLDNHESMWRNGFTEEYFRNWGWATRRILGPWLGSAYIAYILVRHYNSYSSESSFWKAMKNLSKGFWEKR